MAADSTSRFPRLRPAALATVITNVGIVFTGGVVRVTGSGLGCPDWPACEGMTVVPMPSADAGWHQFIEFGNRTLTFVVLAAAVWALWAVKRDAPDRRDLKALAWALIAGILGQAILGGITVLTGLNPWVVMAHFLLSMVLIAIAVTLHERVSQPPPAEPHRALRSLAALFLPVAVTVLVLGTFVTAAGPHAGDPGTPRLGFNIRNMAFAHAQAVWVLITLTTATLVVARGLGARRTQKAAAIALGIELAQGGIGYTQYALGIPASLVSLHLLGAALVWVAVLRMALATSPAPNSPQPAEPALAGDPVQRDPTAP